LQQTATLVKNLTLEAWCGVFSDRFWILAFRIFVVVSICFIMNLDVSYFMTKCM